MIRKIIGLYELITGVFGVIFILVGFPKPFASTENTTSYILGILLFAGTAYAGYGLLNNFKSGLKLSIWSQALQSFSLLIPGFLYKFTGSAFLLIKGSNKGFSFHYAMKPIDYAIITKNTNTTEIQIYLIALVLLFVLFKEK